MTRVDFHVLPAQSRREHDVYICALIEKAWREGRRVHVHCLDDAMAASFDQLLWTFRDTSFVPHALSQPGGDTAVAPVILGSAATPPESAEVLVNLHSDVPAFFSQFEQVIETAGDNEDTRAQARARFRFYKDRGYPIETHKV